MKNEKRYFIRALRGTGLSVPERAALSKTDHVRPASEILRALGWQLYASNVTSVCPQDGGHIGVLFFSKKNRIIKLPFDCCGESPISIERAKLKELVRLKPHNFARPQASHGTFSGDE